MKIAFHTNEIGVRGTELSTFKFAHYNEKILKNESIYIAGVNGQFEDRDWNAYSEYTPELVMKKFKEVFLS